MIRLLSAALLSLPLIAPAATVKLAQGTLSGVRKGAVDAYLGVPFAAPPVGELRWRPPQAAPGWRGVRKADAMPANCYQTPPNGPLYAWTEEYLITGPVSEDCLYLNVWTPAKSPRAKLPVLVWIYGGGFNSGGTSVPLYRGAPLASQGVVVVSFNYRVGPFGFLVHPELANENPAHASGNYGLLDQVAALQWVKKNIAAFGGDPAQVTIAGQSAGAASVHHLIASPLAKGLFQRAIAQSGSRIDNRVPERAEAEATGTKLMQAAGAADLAALRKLPPERIQAASAGMGFRPVADGLLLPEARYAGANTSDVPVLTGLTADEGSSMAQDYGKTTATAFKDSLARRYDALAPDFGALYPHDSDQAASESSMALARDSGLASTWAWAERRLRSSRQPVYVYLWTHAEPGPDAARYRAFHSSELPYVFGTLDAAPRPFTQSDRDLARLVSRYWVNWVKRGDPNGPGLPAWPRFEPANPRVMELDVKPQARDLLPADKRALFERYLHAGGKPAIF